ncbi:Os01g0293501, partial [Oryza sativa Japonica Group]
RRRRRVARVQGGVHRRVQPVLEPRAVRGADGVRTRERHQVVDGEPLGGEALDELVRVEERRRDAGEDGEGGRHVAVAAAGGDRVDEAAGLGHRVAGGEGEDVGAGDLAGADGLHGRLDLVHGVVPAERDRCLLR